MKKGVFYLVLLLVGAGWSCQDDSTQHIADGTQITTQLRVGALCTSTTAPLQRQWLPGDTIGVYVVSGEELTTQNAPLRFVGTTASARGVFTGEIAYTAGAGSYTLYAYYPYSAQAAGQPAEFVFVLPDSLNQAGSASLTELHRAELLTARSTATGRGDQYSELQFTPRFSVVEVALTGAGTLLGKELAAVSLYAQSNATVTTSGALANPVQLNGAFRVDLTQPSGFEAMYTNYQSDFATTQLTESVVLGQIPAQIYWAIAPADYAQNPLYLVARTADNYLATTYLTLGTLTAGGVASLAATLSEGAAPQAIRSLSAAGATANAYVASVAGQRYSFDATVAGNGVIPSGLSEAVSRYEGRTLSATLAGGNARLLWQSAARLIDPTSVHYESGEIQFQLTDRPTALGGNAVLALYANAAAEEALWSWHIWITDLTAEQLLSNAQRYTLYSGYQSDYTGQTTELMDRNLGALRATAGSNVRSWAAPLYQWGRKDPMPWGEVVYDPASKPREYLLSFPAVVTSGAVGQSAAYVGNSYYATAHPATFISTQQASSFDWYWGGGAGDTATERNNFLWGNPTGYTAGQTTQKTLFDPCPVGWKVAHPYLFSAFTSTGNNAAVGSGALTSGTFNQGWSLQYTSGADTYYPAVGYRYDESGSFLFSTTGNYWSSAPSGSSFGGLIFGFTPTALFQRFSYPRGSALAVRCMRDL